MPFDLVRVLRSLLFASPGSLSVKDIQAVFTRFHEEAATLPLAGTGDGSEPVEEAVAATGDASDTGAPSLSPADVPSLVTATQIREAMDVIRGQLEASAEVFHLQETHNGWRLVTTPDCADWVRLLRNQPRPMKLSQSALETLAIVAYRQPVVRSEIESIRGVSVEAPINRLLERELIKITGRADLPGRPIQYGTTEAFLEFVGIKSLEELPASDVLSTREIDQWLQRENQSPPPKDGTVGLDTETGDEQADLELKPEGAANETSFSFASTAATAPMSAPAPQATEPDASTDEEENATP